MCEPVSIATGLAAVTGVSGAVGGTILGAIGITATSTIGVAVMTVAAPVIGGAIIGGVTSLATGGDFISGAVTGGIAGGIAGAGEALLGTGASSGEAASATAKSSGLIDGLSAGVRNGPVGDVMGIGDKSSKFWGDVAQSGGSSGSGGESGGAGGAGGDGGGQQMGMMGQVGLAAAGTGAEAIFNSMGAKKQRRFDAEQAKLARQPKITAGANFIGADQAYSNLQAGATQAQAPTLAYNSGQIASPNAVLNTSQLDQYGRPSVSNAMDVNGNLIANNVTQPTGLLGTQSTINPLTGQPYLIGQQPIA